MEEKLLSIIVPSYNMEKYIQRCLESLIIKDQVLFNKLDIIIVNDGSKDRTSEIAHVFEYKYPGIFRVIDKKNNNYGSCINEALKIIIGKYVKILDADDCFDINFSSYLIALQSCNVDLILTDTLDIDDISGSIVCKKFYDLESDKIYGIEEVLKKYKYLSMNTITYKSSIFKGNWYYQTTGISYTDTQWSFLPLAKVESIMYFPFTVYRYTVSRIGQSMENKTIIKNFWMIEKSALDALKIYLEIRKEMKDQKLILMDNRMNEFLYVPYRNTFTNINGLKFKIDLESYDKQLRDISLYFYKNVGEIIAGQIIKCHCVANWRKKSLIGKIKNRLFFILQPLDKRLAHIKIMIKKTKI